MLSGMVAIFRNHAGCLVGGSSSSCFTSSVALAEASAIRMGVLAVVEKGLKLGSEISEDKFLSLKLNFVSPTSLLLLL
ncbi:hypothetical protein V6N13_086092 [Hibiscus sabdariffa]